MSYYQSNFYQTNHYASGYYQPEEDVVEALGGYNTTWINQQREEDDIMLIIHAFLHMRQK